MGTEQNNEMELDLREIFNILRKRKILVIIITLLATIAAGSISYFYITPIYQASTEILVNKSESEKGSIYNINDINTDLKLISTYSVIIKSPRIMDIVIDNYNLDLNHNELVQKVSINTVKDSQVMKISVTDSDPKEAARLANAIAETSKREIVKIMKVDNVQILAKAKYIEGAKPVKPNIVLNVTIAFILGLITSIGLVFLLEYFDNTIKTEWEVEQILGYPVVGVIGIIGDDKLDKKHSINATQTTRRRSY